MGVIHDTHNVLIYHFEAHDRIRPPLVRVLAQRDDCQLAMHFCHCQSPRYCLAFVVAEVWLFVDGSGKTICDAESGIRADEFAESIPITLVEAVDVEMQEP